MDHIKHASSHSIQAHDMPVERYGLLFIQGLYSWGIFWFLIMTNILGMLSAGLVWWKKGMEPAISLWGALWAFWTVILTALGAGMWPDIFNPKEKDE